MCHGKEGAGDGDLAEDMHLKLRDFRDASTLKDCPTAISTPSSTMARAK